MFRVFGQIYYDLEPFEKYKIDCDVDHYYIKIYRRYTVQRDNDARKFRKNCAISRTRDLEPCGEDAIQAHTVCPDIEAVADIFFAYLYAVRGDRMLEEVQG